MFEKLISTLMASRDQAHIFHWQTTGEGSYAVHKALGKYYDVIPDMLDSLVEAYQGKHGILKGYVTPEKFEDYEKSTAIKYFKALATYIERAYDKIDPKDTNIINQLDTFKDLIYTTIYKLENLQ
jgi:DNA-binding ferritin-like protein